MKVKVGYEVTRNLIMIYDLHIDRKQWYI